MMIRAYDEDAKLVEELKKLLEEKGALALGRKVSTYTSADVVSEALACLVVKIRGEIEKFKADPRYAKK